MELRTSSRPNQAQPRFRNACAQCGQAIFMPEWSEYLSPERVRYLWECEACGYAFETIVVFPERS